MTPSSSSSPDHPVDIHALVRSTTERFIDDHRTTGDGDLGCALVRTAGQLAEDIRCGGLTIEYKTSISDVVTEADKAAEYFVATALTELRPNDGLLGEEGAAAPPRSGRTWVIDPVDGTYNFTSGSDYWCSALALVEGDPADPDEILVGAVHRPIPGITWLKKPGSPTLRNGQPVAHPLAERPADAVSVGTYLHPSRMGNDRIRLPWLAVVEDFACLRMAGAASVDLAGISEGRIGGWLQHSVHDWDWLPGRALVEGAGGRTAEKTVGPVTWKLAGNARTVEDMLAAFDDYLAGS
ncbi:inositol monophosphatase family protein [Corynebacterium mendelii]|uniref:Inositol monophosphatase family protein n=1 Tax=Corynebacterium mendelii TaxID=2765362 RepID=A0A939IWP8_9CORY|nr:inositol monophosphatase family protein [Corynebacterium mendelii]MBN9643655.1 inositol monophosphatase family protein [Corynebacterium mendelii]